LFYFKIAIKYDYLCGIMSERRNNSGNKGRNNGKFSDRPTSQGTKRNFNSTGGDKKRRDAGYDLFDKDELAPPRFLAPRNEYKGKKNEGRDAGKFEKGRPAKRGDSKFSSDSRNRFDDKRGDSKFSGDSRKRFDDKRGDSKFSGDSRKKFDDKRGDSKFSGDSRKKFDDKRGDSKFSGDTKKRFDDQRGDSKFGSDKRRFDDKKDFKGAPKPFAKGRDERSDRGRSGRFNDKEELSTDKKPFRPKYDPEVKVRKSYRERKLELTGPAPSADGEMRLNKYIANSGICSRREADEVIKQGLVSINNQVVTEMGYKVKREDVVKYDGRKIIPEPYVYILMNKPKDFITTTDDDKGRKTVMDLLADKITQRVFPIGRLDRNTTGVLLLTNDGDVAQMMTHPSFNIKKIYHVVLDKKVSGTDLEKLVQGIELEDGMVNADAVSYVESEDRRNVGVEIHSGKNRVVRRMFEALGYEVEKLDRVSMGIFTKKDLPRGKWRHLSQSEMGFLMKMKSKMP
jgi:23S rRNA pseudouridine2605 synthase